MLFFSSLLASGMLRRAGLVGLVVLTACQRPVPPAAAVPTAAEPVSTTLPALPGAPVVAPPAAPLALPPLALPALAPSVAAPARPLQLLEDFENDRRWSLDSAGNFARLDFSERDATRGRWALRAAFTDNGRGKAILRKEVDYDLSEIDELVLDAFNAASEPGVALRLGVYAGKGALYETVAIPLQPGWNRDLRVPLPDAWHSGIEVGRWMADGNRVTRLLIEIEPGQNAAGTVAIDHLRCTAGVVVRRRSEAAIEVGGHPAAPLKRWQTVEFAIDATVRETVPPAPVAGRATPVLPRMTAAVGRFQSPDGTLTTVRGFCAGIEPLADGQLRYRHRLRFTAHRAGTWNYQLGYEADGDIQWDEPRTLFCTGDDAGPGMIGIGRDDPRFFAHSGGSAFYPIGQNVAWAGDYAPYLEAIESYGGNYLRTWMCPWNHPLDVRGRLDVVNFASADGIDRLFALARQRGVAVQLVVQYHGMLTDDWARNPFNQANGGPCLDAREFWTHPQAREGFKRCLDYLVARWASSPQLFAWELFNEANLCPSFQGEDIVAWHREMAAYLKRIDPWRHLVTTSVAGTNPLPGLWRIEDIDFAQPHAYHPQVGQTLDRVLADLAEVTKPMFLAEFGRGTEPSQDQADPEGRHLHQALWLSWMLGMAGTAVPWWWDTHIEANHLHRRFAALVRFAEGEDLRGRPLRRHSSVLRPAGRPEVRVQCLIGPDHVYGYAFSAEAVALPQAKALEPLITAGSKLIIGGVSRGAWAAEFWDTHRGKVDWLADLTSDEQGRLVLNLAEMPRDFAFKLKRKGVTVPGVVLE